MTSTFVGKPMPLLDGSVKVSGKLRFTADITLPGMLHARFLTSIYAHANIRGIDVSAAQALPGVEAVLTARDLPPIAPSSRVSLLLARDRVIFVGQPVVLVLATSEAIAEDALEHIIVDYDPLSAAITMDQALAPDAPLVWPTGIPTGTDDSSIHGASSGGAASTEQFTNIVRKFSRKRGSIEQGFGEADAIVERTFSTPVIHQSYLEPQSMLVQIDPVNDGVTVWSSTQGQFQVRQDVAELLHISEFDVRVVGMPVGGGFGGKIVLYEPLIALAARIVKRPVRLVLTRMEEMIAANPAPAARIWLRLGAKRDGTLTALHASITVDSGCYSSGLGGTISFLMGSMYRLPHFLMESTEVLTFKVSTSAYRAPGAPSGAFALESLVDELATTLNLDPLEMRLKNAVRTGDLRSDDKPWNNIGMVNVLEALQQHPAWRERETARAAGRGVGIAVAGWTGGVEPTAAACMVDREGLVNIHVGSADLSGTSTSFALMAAEVFGVSLEQIRIVSDDTASAPYAGVAGGSKTTFTVGPAVVQAAQEARKQLLEIAADVMEADSADLEIVDGKIQVRGAPSSSIPIAEIASKTFQWSSKYSPVIAHGRHADPETAPGFCAQLAEVEVDPDTGEVEVHRLVLAQDVGRAINPAAVEGQMLGGATQGLGWALYERIAYSDDGQVLSGSWMDYAVPHSTQAARKYETIIVEVPSNHGPFGARGVGEPPVIATAAAVANAIKDAVNARPVDLPMTAPVVLAAIQDGKNGK
ncbi:MAG: xanthine dehydrogenase family protein molybdopterin-binding subunit [Anaerolineae bacterium]|nr:xanthine dehydrogenase family protein molybdopterin-binding subunit [Anaerolineae bacterium]